MDAGFWMTAASDAVTKNAQLPSNVSELHRLLKFAPVMTARRSTNPIERSLASSGTVLSLAAASSGSDDRFARGLMPFN
jgi:hypothetical protein